MVGLFAKTLILNCFIQCAWIWVFVLLYLFRLSLETREQKVGAWESQWWNKKWQRNDKGKMKIFCPFFSAHWFLVRRKSAMGLGSHETFFITKGCCLWGSSLSCSLHAWQKCHTASGKESKKLFWWLLWTMNRFKFYDVLGRVVRSLISTNPWLTVNKTWKLSW